MKQVLNQFVELLRESVIVQGLLSLSVIVIIGHAAFTGTFDQLPKEFWMVTGTIFGFYFKSKNSFEIQKLQQSHDDAVRTMIMPCRCDDDTNE